MKRTNSRALLRTLALLCMLPASFAAAELKIAVLDTQRAIFESEEAKALSERANSELKGEQDSARKLAEEIQALTAKLQKDAEVMGPADQRKAQKDIEDKQIEYQFMVNKLQKEVNDRRQELLRQIGPKVDAVLKDLIEIEGYDLIMERANIHYVNSKHDITRRVTEKLNEKR